MAEEHENDVPELRSVKHRNGGDSKADPSEIASLLQNGKQTEVEEDLWEFYVPTPPDGGWGWVIAMASFFNNFLVDGIGYCFGIFLMEYAQYFQAGVGVVSLASSLLCGFYLFVGPVVAAFVNKWGCRKVGIVGSLIAAFAFVISTFSPNIFVFQLTYGILGGFGFGMMYLPAVVGVGYYFEKKRALATGIAVCGTGIGTFVMAPFAKAMLKILDWKNTHYILAGLLLQGCIFSALMRPLTARRRVTANTQHSKANGKAEDETSDNDKLLKKELSTTANRSKTSQSSGMLSVAGKNTSVPQRLHASVLIQPNNRTASEIEEDLGRPLYKKDLFYSGSVFNIPAYKPKEADEEKQQKEAEIVASLISIPSSEVHYQRLSCLNALPKPIADILAEMLDLYVLKNRAMMVLCLGNFFGMLGFYVPIIFSSDRAVQYGVSEENAALLLSIMGICNTIGRVLSGLMVVFIPNLSPLLVNNISIFLAGLAVLFTPFCYTFATMALAIGAYGLFAAAFVSLVPIIVCELVGLNKLTNGFGLICLVRGITAIVGPPLEAAFISLAPVLICDSVGLEKLTNGYGLICLVRGITAMLGPPIEGMLFDYTGDYDATFYMGGASILVSAAFQFMLFSNCLRKHNKTK